ncbi:MAG: peptide MFS transporter, partial [Chlamydiae bacterium]|nr:peptide MFS transporter [Chlamydiota bacterium]
MKQPKALYLLNAVSMWECFSYYGMRALLLLFLVEELRYTDDRALSLYALYTTLVELGGMLGGFLADRYLGLKAAIFLGGCAIALGHICMAFGSLFPPCFLVGLGCIIAGTALFRPSVAALLGAFYDKEDSRREAGYTLYYAGINLGGLLASVLCGVVASIYGWSAGFILATFGMILGLSCLLLGRKYLQGHGGTLLPRTKNMQCMWSLGILGSGCVCACLLY